MLWQNIKWLCQLSLSKNYHQKDFLRVLHGAKRNEQLLFLRVIDINLHTSSQTQKIVEEKNCLLKVEVVISPEMLYTGNDVILKKA